MDNFYSAGQCKSFELSYDKKYKIKDIIGKIKIIDIKRMSQILPDLRFTAYNTKFNDSSSQFKNELDGIVTLIGPVYLVQLLWNYSRITCTQTKIKEKSSSFGKEAKY